MLFSSRVPPLDPFGSSDLDPLRAGQGGGMIFDPLRSGPQGHFRPQPGVPPNMP